MDLKALVGNNYRGIVTFSDIHAHADKLRAGIKYGLDNDLFLLFLGDLVDGHDKPMETVLAVRAILDEGRGAFVIGNHDDKFRRHAQGAKVQFKGVHLKTLADVGERNLPLFFETMVAIVEHKNAAHHWKYGNWVFTHGACAREFWDADHSTHNKEIKRKIVHKAMYGEVDGNAIDDDGYPLRKYGWVDHVPADHNVVVGHDRKPYARGSLTKDGPYHHRNDVGGRVIFTDTGCGKSDDGYLTLTVFKIQNDTLELVGHEAI
jgi:hypothetical protein